MSDQIPTQSTDTSEVTQASKKNLAMNTLSSILFAAFNAGTSMYMVPFQIHHLGIENYGVVCLAISFGLYLQVCTVAITGAIGRFVTLYTTQKNYKEANSYLNTQLIAAIWTIIFILPAAGFVAYFAPRFLNIPAGQETNAQILFVMVDIAFCITLISAVYKVTVFVSQRFDVNNILEVINQVFRYSTWIIMFVVLAPQIWQIGTGYLIGALATVVAHMIAFKKLTPQLKPALNGFDKQKFFEVIRMGGWMTVGQVGTMIYLGIDSIIINKILGSASVGKYSTIAGLSLQIQTLSGMMMYVVAPPAIDCYVKQQWAQLATHAARAIKFTSLALSILLGIICGLSIPFMIWWLGPSFKQLYLLIWVMLPHLVINLGMVPLFAITYASNKVSIPGFATIASGLIKLSLALLLIKYTNWGILALAAADMIALTLKNIGFIPVYSSRIMKCSSLKLYKAVTPSVLVFFWTASIGWELSQLFNLATLPRLAGTTLLLGIVSALTTYALALNKDDKKLLFEIMPWNKKRQ